MSIVYQNTEILLPAISPMPGFYNGNLLTISIQYPFDQIIFFTLDGSIPVEYVSPRYLEPIQLNLNYDCVTVTLLLYRSPSYTKRYLQFQYCYFSGSYHPYQQYGYWYYYRSGQWHYGHFDFDEGYEQV